VKNVLEADVQRLEHEADDLQRYTDGIRAKDRPLPAVHDMASYLDVRLRESQLEGYYEPKARLLQQRLQALKAVEVTLALAAAGFAAVAAISPTVGAWAAVVTTAAGAGGRVCRLGALRVLVDRVQPYRQRASPAPGPTHGSGRPPDLWLRTYQRVRTSDLGTEPGMDGQVGRGEHRRYRLTATHRHHRSE
jgi:hypothetical protein